MKDFEIEYLENVKKQFETIKQDWANTNIDDIDAYLELKDLNQELFYFIFNHQTCNFNGEMNTLYNEINDYMAQIKKQRKIVYILRTDKTKMIAVSNESLVQKCIARLGKDVQVETCKTKVCQTEDDLDAVLLEYNLNEEPNEKLTIS